MPALKLKTLVDFLDNLLHFPEPVNDRSNNGLQVEGKDEVERAVFAVDASLELFKKASEGNADFIFVHHGMSWGDNFQHLTGINAKRLEVLFKNGVSLYASHLPLDAHPEVGHNAAIAKRLELRDIHSFFEYGNIEIGCAGTLPSPITVQELKARVDNIFHTDSSIKTTGPEPIEKIGIVSGSAADAAAACREEGISAFVTGESGHSSYHTLIESGVTVITAGHYRTEIPGVEAVMERVANEFGINCRFVDIPTGL